MNTRGEFIRLAKLEAELNLEYETELTNVIRLVKRDLQTAFDDNKSYCLLSAETQEKVRRLIVLENTLSKGLVKDMKILLDDKFLVFNLSELHSHCISWKVNLEGIFADDYRKAVQEHRRKLLEEVKNG